MSINYLSWTLLCYICLSFKRTFDFCQYNNLCDCTHTFHWHNLASISLSEIPQSFICLQSSSTCLLSKNRSSLLLVISSMTVYCTPSLFCFDYNLLCAFIICLCCCSSLCCSNTSSSVASLSWYTWLHKYWGVANLNRLVLKAGIWGYMWSKRKAYSKWLL
jgi:hypothetical protein